MTEKFYGWGLPIDISTHGAQIDQLIVIIHVIMALLFLGWFAFFAYTIVRFRQRSGHKAIAVHGHFKAPTYLEIGVAITEVVLLTAFSFPIWNKYTKQFPPLDQSLEVHVVAEQFAWNVHYPGADRIFGKTDPKLMGPSNPVGLDPADRAGKDDVVTINQLHIPEKKPVIVRLSSKDVIHSFFLPVMRIKQDAIPGQKISVWFEAVRSGEFEIACAQLCGLGHYRMRGFFIVEPKDKFDAWFAGELAQKAANEPPPAAENTEALSAEAAATTASAH